MLKLIHDIVYNLYEFNEAGEKLGTDQELIKFQEGKRKRNGKMISNISMFTSGDGNQFNIVAGLIEDWSDV